MGAGGVSQHSSRPFRGLISTHSALRKLQGYICEMTGHAELGNKKEEKQYKMVNFHGDERFCASKPSLVEGLESWSKCGFELFGGYPNPLTERPTVRESSWLGHP